MAELEGDDQRAERLLRIAMDVAVRIREEPPDAVAREFDGLDRQELRDLALLAAACVDVARPMSEVVWWADVDRPAPAPAPRKLRPCGTRAAYNRHLARGEPVDLACQMANRRYERQRPRARQLRAVA